MRKGIKNASRNKCQINTTTPDDMPKKVENRWRGVEGLFFKKNPSSGVLFSSHSWKNLTII